MRTLDRAGSVFLRAILRRMKVLGLNQSALAQRMKVSRAYVSKVFSGDVNISFHTACRFARALGMDFMPGLAEKRSRGEAKVNSGRVVASIVVGCLAMLMCSAEVVRVPSWLPENQRFEVAGSSNEIAQVEQTLGLMRDSLHPKLRAMMGADDWGPTLEWVVRVSLPSATNETAYFESFRKPLPASAFDLNLLTNRAHRLTCVPHRAKLSLVFDDGRKDSVSRAVPGVDYPGVGYEDEGSTERVIRLRLRAPKELRHFKVKAEPWDGRGRKWQCKWIESHGNFWREMPPQKTIARSDSRVFWASCRTVTERYPKTVLVFARADDGLWGPPSRVVIVPDGFSVRTYGRSNLLVSADYGTFRDLYRYDEKDRILGFTRCLPGMARGEEYSSVGERIIDSYADDRPKTTRKVRYAIVDGKIVFEDGGEDVRHANEPPEDRASRW